MYDREKERISDLKHIGEAHPKLDQTAPSLQNDVDWRSTTKFFQSSEFSMYRLLEIAWIFTLLTWSDSLTTPDHTSRPSPSILLTPHQPPHHRFTHLSSLSSPVHKSLFNLQFDSPKHTTQQHRRLRH